MDNNNHVQNKVDRLGRWLSQEKPPNLRESDPQNPQSRRREPASSSYPPTPTFTLWCAHTRETTWFRENEISCNWDSGEKHEHLSKSDFKWRNRKGLLASAPPVIFKKEYPIMHTVALPRGAFGMAYLSFFIFIQIGLPTVLIKQDIALCLHCYFPTLSTVPRKRMVNASKKNF